MFPVPDPSGVESELNLHEYINIIRRRRAAFLQVAVVVVAIGFVVTAAARPVYATKAKILVPPAQSSINLIDATNPIGALMGMLQPDSAAAQMQQLQGRPFQLEAMRAAGIPVHQGAGAPAIKVQLADASSRLSQMATGGSQVIDVTVEWTDRAGAVRLANELVTLHLQKMDEYANGNLGKMTEFVRGAKTAAQRDLEKSEDALIRFTRQHPAVQPEAQRDARNRELIDLEARMRAGESNVASGQAQVISLGARLAKIPTYIMLKTSKENPSIDRLRGKLVELELQRLDLLKEFQPGSRYVKPIELQILEVKQQLDAEPATLSIPNPVPNPVLAPLQTRLGQLEADLEGYRAEASAARAQLAAKKGLLQQVGPLEIEQSRLVNLRANAQTAYNNYSATLRDLEIRAKAKLQVARPIELPFLPESPIRPRPAVNAALTLVLALLLGTAAALLQEFLDDRVNSPDDLERLATLPPLGHVPLITGEQGRLIASLPSNSQVAEAYRALRSSVGFAGIDAPVKTIQVTSASKGEGKTLTSTNLATAMALDGRKVILVDADLRRPSLHRLLQVNHSPGLSEVLAGIKTLDEVLRPSGVDNLQIITAGPIPPNPTELLGSQAFDRVLEELKARADMVIVDTPPCIPVTDPLIVAGKMDGVILVLHVGQTRKPSAKHAIQALARARARILGVVYNQVPTNTSGYSYYYSYYSSYYRQGYYHEADAGTNGRNGSKKRLRLPKASATSERSGSSDEA